MVAWGEILGSLPNQTDLQTALNAKADKNGTGNVTADSFTVVDAPITRFSLPNRAVGPIPATEHPGVAVKRLLAGDTNNINPQGAVYTEGVRIVNIWDQVNPNIYDKWNGLYCFTSLRPTAATTGTIDTYGVQAQASVFREDTQVFNFENIYGGFFVANHQHSGKATGGVQGVSGRAFVQQGTAEVARGTQGLVRLFGTAGAVNRIEAATGRIDIEVASASTPIASAVSAHVATNAGTITEAHGVLVRNSPIGGSGTRKFGIKIEPQTVATPGNWQTVVNFYSQGNVPNIFEGQIISSRPQGQAPLDVISNALCPNLNANFIEGQNLAALDARYVSSASIMPRARQISANRYYLPAAAEISTATVAVAANTLIALPFDTAMRINGAAIEITTPGPAGSFALLGFYACGLKGEPGVLIEDAGAVPTNANGIQTAVLTVRPIERPFWLAVICSHAISIRSMVNNAAQANRVYGVADFITNTNVMGLTATQGSTALPSTFPAGTTTNTGYAIYARGA